MKIEDCKGCLTPYEGLGSSCMWFSESLTCPCSICLVKVVCITYCESMRKYMRKYIKEYVSNPK